MTRHAAIRIARIAGIALVAAFGAYLVGMNVFLRTRLFRDAISGDPDSLLVDYRGAYSLLPGRIHVDDLTIRGRDSSVEWILRLDRCDFRVALLQLARKKFHASHVRGDGLSLRVRLRKEADVTPEVAHALPPVPGFLDPPLVDVGPPPPPLTDKTYNLWSVELDDVDANHVRELWIDTIRYAGDLEVRGRWAFRPLRRLDVGPATISLRALDVTYGMGEPWVSSAVGELNVTVHPFSLLEVQGADMIDRIDVDGDVRGTLRVANMVNRALGPRVADSEGPPARIDDAPFEAHLHVNRGVLRGGTQVSTDRFQAQVRSGAVAIETALAADVTVDDGGTARLDVDTTGLRFSQNGSERLRAKSMAASLASHDLDLAQMSKGLDLQGSRLDGEDVVARFDGTSLAMPRVSVAAAAARFEPGDAPKSATVTITADALAVDRKDLAARGDLLARLVVSETHTDASGDRLDLSGSEVQLRNAHADMKGARAVVPSFEAHLRSVAYDKAGPTGHVAVELPDIELPLSLLPNGLLLLPKGITIDGGYAKGAVSADVDLGPMAATGDARVTAEGLRARIGSEPLEGALRIDLRARESDGGTSLSDSTIAFDGTVGAPPKPWWARATMRDARFDARGGLHFRAQLAASAKDASPVAAVVANGTAIPRWVLDAISTQGLTASGQLLVSPSTFQARSVTARASGIDMGFELAQLGPESEWALLLDVGVVCAGIDTFAGHTDVLLLGARPWFEKKAASLRVAERRYGYE